MVSKCKLRWLPLLDPAAKAVSSRAVKTNASTPLPGHATKLAPLGCLFRIVPGEIRSESANHFFCWLTRCGAANWRVFSNYSCYKNRAKAAVKKGLAERAHPTTTRRRSSWIYGYDLIHGSKAKRSRLPDFAGSLADQIWDLRLREHDSASLRKLNGAVAGTSVNTTTRRATSPLPVAISIHSSSAPCRYQLPEATISPAHSRKATWPPQMKRISPLTWRNQGLTTTGETSRGRGRRRHAGPGRGITPCLTHKGVAAKDLCTLQREGMGKSI